MTRSQRAAAVGGVVFLAAGLAIGQNRKEYRYLVKPHAKVSINNQFGPISITPGDSSRVEVVIFLHSDKVEVTQSQNGNRIELASHLLSGADSRSGQVDYDVRVPADANVVMHSATGQLQASGLKGDISAEGAAPTIDLHDLDDSHIQIKTMEGTVKLVNVHGGHVEITSVSGPVMLTSVDGASVQVNSNSGGISYNGNFGGDGTYSMRSHTGAIEVVAPANTMELLACTVTGRVDGEYQFRPVRWPCATLETRQNGSPGNALLSNSISSVHLFTFSGRITLKKK